MPLKSTGPSEAPEPGRVSITDIEERFRQLDAGARAAVGRSEKGVLGIASVGSALVAVVYLLGRRRGRRRASVLEIRRV